MIVDGIARHEHDDGHVVRSATIRLGSGQSEMIGTTVSAELDGGPADDVTAALPFALLLSMRVGEDLELEGRVDSELLARADDIQRYYLACNPRGLQRVALRTRGALEAGRPAARAAACFSRGVDSLFQVVGRRSAGGPLDALVFVDNFEPIHGDRVRAEERELAGRAAELIGLPLMIVDAPLRHLSDTYFNWEDAVGAGLAWVAHSVTGGVGRFVISAGDHVASLAPCGYGPAIDPLLSSSRMRIEPGDVSATRMAKVAWLSSHAPDLLPLLKVCSRADRSDNCGRCGKCLLTMACRRAAGVLEQATGFPGELDLDALAAGPARQLEGVLQFNAVREAATAIGDDELVAAASEALRANLAALPAPAGPGASFRSQHTFALRILLDEGRAGGAGLVQGFDVRERRHVHAAGSTPSGTVTAELGSLIKDARQAPVPLWVLRDGRLATVEISPRGAAPRIMPRVRHALANVVRNGTRGLPHGIRRGPLGPARPEEGQPPAGYLFAEPAPDRIALWVGEDPISGDQFSASSDREIRSAGYPKPRLVGYLLARAPVTGRLGEHPKPAAALGRHL